jgi:dolichyl-phosphate-mannose--protein O-mannosyl transferase
MYGSILILCLIATLGFEPIAAGDGDSITCGSVVKLIHRETTNHLHSHQVTWGSGSGQQSVTTTPEAGDQNSFWVVKEASTTPVSCEVGQPVECGTKIRLEHASTGRNLHSHLFRAPLSGNQEVSGFGEGGTGDTGDNWVLTCDTAGDKHWKRGAVVHFEHVDTKKWLSSSTKHKFTQQNCGQACPIMHQTEVSAAGAKGVNTKFKTGQGVYFPPSDPKLREDDEDDYDDEL